MPRRFAAVILWVLLAACSPTTVAPPPRPVEPPASAAQGPAADLARAMFSRLARAANALEDGTWAEANDVRDGYNRARQQCEEQRGSLEASLGDPELDRVRRQVLAACLLLVQSRADVEQVDAALGLVQLALSAPGAGIEASDRRN